MLYNPLLKQHARSSVPLAASQGHLSVLGQPDKRSKWMQVAEVNDSGVTWLIFISSPNLSYEKRQ